MLAKVSSTRKMIASSGLELLKQAVLLVLYEETEIAYKGSSYALGRTLEQHEISNRLDIPYVINPSGNTYSLIQGVLDQLKSQGYAHHYLSQGWAITENGVSVIDS